jgi:hypothetical protein
MTRTTPRRRTILHLSHIVFTEGLTFILLAPSSSSYLYLYVIRPLVRSYGESSTRTRSPGRIRM